MELLERYLQAVRFFLPHHQQDDIVRELSENLTSQVDDREEALGRPLTEDEQADILRRHGHPMIVAGRYRSQQQLIGPAFFPMYRFALKIGLGAALLVTVLIAIASTLLAGDPGRHILEAFLAFPGRGLMVFAWTTLGFAALDLAQSRLKLTRDWDPRSLPKVVMREDRISRTNSSCELLLALACVVWLLLVPQSPSLVLGPASAFLDLAPIWRFVYIPILLLMLASVYLSALNLLRPYWTVARSWMRIGIHTAALLLYVVLFRAGEWVVARPGAIPPGGTTVERLVDVVNAGCEIGLLAACVFALIDIVRAVHRMQSRRKSSTASGSAQAPIAR